MLTIKKTIAINNKTDIVVPLFNKTDTTGDNFSFDKFSEVEEKKSINPVVDREKKTFYLDDEHLDTRLDIAFYGGVEFHSSDFAPKFSYSEIVNYGESLLNSFFVFEYYNSYSPNNNNKLFTSYYSDFLLEKKKNVLRFYVILNIGDDITFEFENEGKRYSIIMTRPQGTLPIDRFNIFKDEFNTNNPFSDYEIVRGSTMIGPWFSSIIWFDVASKKNKTIKKPKITEPSSGNVTSFHHEIDPIINTANMLIKDRVELNELRVPRNLLLGDNNLLVLYQQIFFYCANSTELIKPGLTQFFNNKFFDNITKTFTTNSPEKMFFKIIINKEKNTWYYENPINNVISAKEIFNNQALVDKLNQNDKGVDDKKQKYPNFEKFDHTNREYKN